MGLYAKITEKVDSVYNNAADISGYRFYIICECC